MVTNVLPPFLWFTVYVISRSVSVILRNIGQISTVDRMGGGSFGTESGDLNDLETRNGRYFALFYPKR